MEYMNTNGYFSFAIIQKCSNECEETKSNWHQREKDILASSIWKCKYMNCKCNQRQIITSVICLFGVLRRFQHCTGHITTGSWKGRGNQYI